MSLTLLNREEFDKLSNEEKRVAIARDVIAREKAGLLLMPPKDDHSFLDEIQMMNPTCGVDPKEFFNSEPCHVCAKGAMVCAWVGNFNSYSLDSVRHFAANTDLVNFPQELVSIFGEQQLNLIESAFEGWGGFPKEYPFFRNLSEIMQNIIDNNGTFVP